MAKINRGNTTKLSIRISEQAKKQIAKVANNLGLSNAGVILFELTKLLKNPPPISKMEELENSITLERNHFVLTVNEKLMHRINNLAEDYDMKKNVLIGYIISNHFQNNIGYLIEREDTKPKKLMLQVNETLKKKMIKYSEENYIQLNALVAYSILKGPYEGLPSYENGETVQIFTNVPEYIGELVKEEAVERNIREHFYTSLCIYKQLMTPEGRFFE